MIEFEQAGRKYAEERRKHFQRKMANVRARASGGREETELFEGREMNNALHRLGAAAWDEFGDPEGLEPGENCDDRRDAILGAILLSVIVGIVVLLIVFA